MKSVLSRLALQQIVKSINSPKIGETWMHKTTKNEYRVVNFSLRSSDCKPDVVYTRDDNKDESRIYWTRDLNEFLDRFNRIHCVK